MAAFDVCENDACINAYMCLCDCACICMHVCMCLCVCVTGWMHACVCACIPLPFIHTCSLVCTLKTISITGNFTPLLCFQLVEERLNKDICDLFMQSRDTLTKLAEQYKITWFYSTLHGLFLRGPAEAVKEASVYLNNNVSCDNCRCPTATVSQASGYHDNNVIKVTRNEPTVAAVKQTSGNVNSKSSDRFRGHDNCPTTPAVVLQPDGTMVAKVNKKKCLPGYKSHGTIVVAYDFPAGVQGVSGCCGILVIVL